MDRSKSEAKAREDNSPSWANIVAETTPRPGASFSDLLSWTLDVAESSDLLSTRERAAVCEAAVEHLARLTGDDARRLDDVVGYLFTISHRRPPTELTRSELPLPAVRREGRYRVATRFLRIAG